MKIVSSATSTVPLPKTPRASPFQFLFEIDFAKGILNILKWASDRFTTRDYASLLEKLYPKPRDRPRDRRRKKEMVRMVRNRKSLKTSFRYPMSKQSKTFATPYALNYLCNL